MRKFSTYFIIFTILLTIGLVYSIAQPKTEWTVATLKEYFEGRLASIQLAVTKAEEATEKRFEGVNEFRGSLEDQSRTLMPRLEQESKDKAQDARIQNNEDELKKLANMKQGGNIVWTYMIGGVALIISIVSIMRNEQKKGLK